MSQMGVREGTARAARYEDGFRVLQGRREYVTYPDNSSIRIWFSDVPWRYETHDHSAVEVLLTMEYASDLQRHLDIRYSTIYLSLIDKLYVCDLTHVDRTLHKTTCTSYDISRRMCKEFFLRSL